MPRVALTTENKVQQGNQYPKLSLDRGERALILAIEKEPILEFRHVLEGPELDEKGNIIKEIKKNFKQEDYEATKMEFFAQHLCFGDFGVVRDKGTDPDNCPTCKAAEDEPSVKAPVPYYAMHIIRYKLKPGTWELADPFSVECLGWTFGPSRLNTLIDIAADLKKDDNILHHDLRLGPCDNKQFQKYDVHVSQSAQWLEGETEEKINERKALVAQTYQNNQAPDLSTLIAKRVTKGEALGDIQRTIDRYNEAYHRGSSTTVPDLTASQSKDEGVFSPETPGEAAAGEGFKVDIETGEVTGEAPAKEMKSMDFKDILNEL